MALILDPVKARFAATREYDAHDAHDMGREQT